MLCLNPIIGLVLAIFICHGIYFSNRCSCQNISFTPITGVTCTFGVRVCLMCYSGSFSVSMLVHFIILIVSDLSSLSYNHGSFISCWFWILLNCFVFKTSIFRRPDQWNRGQECKYMSICSEHVCIQLEYWATVCAVDHVKIACSFTGVWLTVGFFTYLY